MGPHWKDAGAAINPAWMTIALPLGMAFGALSNGWLSDVLFRSIRWKPIALYMACATAVASILYLHPMTISSTILMLFLCGFFVYGPHSTFWVLVPDLVGHRRAGTATGIMNCYAYILAGLGEPLVGHLLDVYKDTGLIFIVVACACTCSGLRAIFIRR
jgi:OPA family glycerol-3-phosphate transporter-like MFS transporter